MFRALGYVTFGWFLLAVGGSLGHIAGVTAVLPATSVPVVLHLAFTPGRARPSLPYGLTVAVVLGYLADLHQGGPPGVSALAHGCCYLGAHFLARRLVLVSWRARLGATLLYGLALDLVTFVILAVTSGPLGLSLAALVSGLSLVPWRAVLTALLAQPIWSVLDAVSSRLGRAAAGARRWQPTGVDAERSAFDVE